MEVELEEGCMTPRSQIRGAPEVCPPPPRKRPAACNDSCEYAKKRELPKKGFFQPSDLDLIFTIAPRREALC
ncbi:hypothetical protein CDL15_Pgr022587 [Punica granatum]|nr:hypothetical protein CDL15_Pgr022587 [Punica granatum]